MKKNDINIALKLEGPESEKGLIRLDDFLRELVALREALASIDREANGESTLYYRVVDLSHNSPATVVIEPVLKEQKKGPRMGNRYGHLPEQIHHRFFETIGFIKNQDTKNLKNVAEPVIDAIADLLAGLGTEFAKGEIANNSVKFNLDAELKHRVELLLKPEFHSYGSVEGELLALNLARGNRFYIYPDQGPRSVSCLFPEQLFENAQSAIRKRVRVYGTKYFRESTGFPFKIADVKRLDILDPSGIPQFRPKQRDTHGKAADEIIKEDREEWDNRD